MGSLRRPRRLARRNVVDTLEGRRLLADLFGIGFDVSQDFIGGGSNPSVSIQFAIRNQGQPGFEDVPSFVVEFYLSSNATIATSDTLLASVNFPALDGGQSETRTVTIDTQSPSHLPAFDPFRNDNQYFIGIIIDPDQQVIDFNRTNNSNRGNGLDRAIVGSEHDLPRPVDGVNVLARALPFNTNVAGSFSDEWVGATDQDVYQFTASAGQTLSFDVDSSVAAGSQDAYLRVFDQNWSLVAEDDNTPGPGEATGNTPFLVHQFATAGPHFVVIGGTDDRTSNPRVLLGRTASETGAYTLRATTLPPPPAAPDLLATSDSGVSSTDNITNDTTPTFRVVGQPNLVARLYAGGVLVGQDTSGPAGTYDITSSALLAFRSHVMTATIGDASGNEGLPSPPLSVVIDTFAGSAAPRLAGGSDTGSSTFDGITRDNTPSFSTPADPDVLLVRYFRNGTELGSVAPSNGTWTFDVTTPLADGTYSFTAVSSDVADGARGHGNS